MDEVGDRRIMRSTGEDGERPIRNAGLGLATEPHAHSHGADVSGLGVFWGNERVTLRRVFGGQLRQLVLVAGDVIMALVAQVGGHVLAGDAEGLRDLLDRGPLSPEGFAASVAAVSTVFLLALYRGYRDLHRPHVELLRDVITATVSAALLTIAVLYLYVPARGVSKAAVLAAGVLTAIPLCIWRVPFARSARGAYRLREATLVSADPPRWRNRLPEYVSVRHALTPVDFLEAPPPTDCVVVAPDVPMEYREQIVAWALRSRADLYVVPNMYEILMTSGRLTHLGDIPLMTVYRLGLPIELRVVKRALDLAGALLLLIVFFPVLMIVPLLIWLEDRGPVFYRQRRVGRDGRIFEILKFRTMVPDAEKATGPILARPNDPRVTRVGKFLRTTRLDELPQIFNVLKGQMSLVGPRPERPEFVASIVRHNRMFRAREAVKPGITGLAQVLGRYDSDPDTKLQFDLIYITRYTLVLDLLVLLWTVPVMLFPHIVDPRDKLLKGLSGVTLPVQHGSSGVPEDK